MMSTNSTQKGKRGERKASKLLNSMGYAARRSQQYQGVVFDPGSADVADDQQMIKEGYDPLPARVEVKYGYDDKNLWHKTVQEWIETARQETPYDREWCILWKRSYRPWVIIWDLSGVPVMSEDVEVILRKVIGNGV